MTCFDYYTVDVFFEIWPTSSYGKYPILVVGWLIHVRWLISPDFWSINSSTLHFQPWIHQNEICFPFGRWSIELGALRVEGFHKFTVQFDWFSSWWLNQPIWKICSSNWMISQNRGENQKCLKPPPSFIGMALMLNLLDKPTLQILKWQKPAKRLGTVFVLTDKSFASKTKL